uniref:SAM domain-containing protein n=1 Tax=Macrostomum lignano TaxID=282301 RepID=A0A1I8G3F6_9PLAT
PIFSLANQPHLLALLTFSLHFFLLLLQQFSLTAASALLLLHVLLIASAFAPDQPLIMETRAKRRSLVLPSRPLPATANPRFSQVLRESGFQCIMEASDQSEDSDSSDSSQNMSSFVACGGEPAAPVCKYLIEAAAICNWLEEAGFPQLVKDYNAGLLQPTDNNPAAAAALTPRWSGLSQDRVGRLLELSRLYPEHFLPDPEDSDRHQLLPVHYRHRTCLCSMPDVPDPPDPLDAQVRARGGAEEQLEQQDQLRELQLHFDALLESVAADKAAFELRFPAGSAGLFRIPSGNPGCGM